MDKIYALVLGLSGGGVGDKMGSDPEGGGGRGGRISQQGGTCLYVYELLWSWDPWFSTWSRGRPALCFRTKFLVNGSVDGGCGGDVGGGC